MILVVALEIFVVFDAPSVVVDVRFVDWPFGRLVEAVRRLMKGEKYVL